jgi:alpha-L-fucosidase
MVSPDGNGRIPPNQERRLRSIGAWLERYGEAVYATRAVGLREQPAWGYVTRSRSGDRVYCIVRRWPSDGRLIVPIDGAVKSARLIGQSGDVPVSTVQGRPVIDLSMARPMDATASVVVVHLQ